MNRTLTAEIAGAAALQLTLGALLIHATERATDLETEQAHPSPEQIPHPRPPVHTADGAR
jgi:hypothetical protein